MALNQVDFSQVKQFSPEQLMRQLSQFDGNVADTFKAIEDILFVKLRPTNRKTTDYAAKLGEMVMVDSTTANVGVTFPVSTPQNAGQVIAVACMSALNACNVSCIDGTSTINQSTGVALTGVSLRVFYSSGIGWYG